MAEQEAKQSGQEKIKLESRGLRGNLAEELADGNPFVSDDSYELLKFHGSYQGYDRDSATERKKAGLDKLWEFMVRMKAPGGRITAKQYLALDAAAAKYANGTLRITTRETFQFHCIVKDNLKKHIAAINELMLTTLGGCGDVVRNVMCSPAPKKDKIHTRLYEDAQAVSEFTMPTTGGYHEIWVDGENLASPAEGEPDDLYGKVYLPRKFKISISHPEDNSVDALTHDLALVQVWQGETLLGYNVYLGGGLGIKHNNEKTYPRLASPIAFVKENELLKAVEAVVKLQRDHGDRADRQHARLKYVVEENGLEWTRKTLEEYFGRKLEDVKPTAPFAVPDHMGWHEQGDGKWFLGVTVSSGRIVDRADEKVRTGFYTLLEKYGFDIVLTADQNIIFANIEEKDKADVEKHLRSYGIKLTDQITSVYRNMLACVALPTCGKALAEAERVKLPLIAEIEKTMEKNNVLDERISIRIAGCPNGCSRPYAGEIGIVGRMPDHYALYIGGDFEGTRLSEKILDRLPYANITEVLDILFAKWKAERKDAEMFGNFAHRVGEKNLAKLIEEKLKDKYKWAVAA